MRILLTVASLRPENGGPARSVPGLANALADQDVEVHVWSPEVPDHIVGPIKFVLHQGPLEDALDQAKGLDLIHDNGLWLPMNHRVAMAAKRRGIPRIVSPRGMLEPWALNHKKWKKRLAWWLYQRCDLRAASALHATAESEAIQFKQLGFKQQITIIPNGVDILAGKYSSSLQTSKAKSQKPQRTALFVSRIHSKKGLPLLVDAWAKVKPVGWRMVIAGPDEGGHRAAVEALVEKAGLSGEWEFCGPLEGDAKQAGYENADLFILPTHSENFGIVVAEALSHGLPVITTHGAPWRLLEEERCGWWVPISVEGISSALADAICRSPDELSAMGERGRTVVGERFAWGGIARQFIECYRRILDESSKPDRVRLKR